MNTKDLLVEVPDKIDDNFDVVVSLTLQGQDWKVKILKSGNYPVIDYKVLKFLFMKAALQFCETLNEET